LQFFFEKSLYIINNQMFITFSPNPKYYLEQQANEIHNVRLEIDIKTPHEEKGLQVADCISWSVFRKYEFSDRTYYDLIKGKIAEENMLF